MMENKIEHKNVKWLPADNVVTHELSSTLPDESEICGVIVLPFDINTGVWLANIGTKGWQLPGAHKQWNETAQEMATRAVFEELGGELAALVPLGAQHIILEGSTPPQYYEYPFPKATFAVFFGLIKNIGQPTSSIEVGPPKCFMPLKAEMLDVIKFNKLFYKQGLAIAEKLSESA